MYNANTFNNPNKEVKYNINTILWHYEVFERTDALNAVDFDIKDLKDETFDDPMGEATGAGVNKTLKLN